MDWVKLTDAKLDEKEELYLGVRYCNHCEDWECDLMILAPGKLYQEAVDLGVVLVCKVIWPTGCLMQDPKALLN